ncbi:hypothetical protein [Spodoptera cosmioides nucleopolyhedrovirus]|uniref:Uncharacterized protein n=1 Tax=Spodoptera cosmioides nucleopolyhedrovirus TaxID=2605774 RepID=A0A6B7KGR2_9ABAC|nr:hypothetical protein [Spodoptera cosmioides nucleopolyhedrovirus]
MTHGLTSTTHYFITSALRHHVTCLCVETVLTKKVERSFCSKVVRRRNNTSFGRRLL